MINWSAR